MSNLPVNRHEERLARRFASLTGAGGVAYPYPAVRVRSSPLGWFLVLGWGRRGRVVKRIGRTVADAEIGIDIAAMEHAFGAL